MAGPSFRQGPKIGDRSGIGSAVTSRLTKITWEDGSESHVTPEHAAQIRAQAARLRVQASGHGRSGM